jgi:predicted regulator of Ras-like GTPase activity (Roadblock/LC7/MglB family)
MELDIVAAGWPDGVRQELAQLKIPDAKIALPPVDLCEGLKRGRIQYPWRTLRCWIQPTPVYASPSPHDDMVLELPLGTLTPLFLDFIRANPVNRQVADAENITEFFRKAEQVSSASADILQPLFTGPHQSNVQPPLTAATVPVSAPPAPAAPPVVIPSPAAAQPAAAPGIAVETEALCLPVQVIANSCPEPVLRDIASFGLANSRIEIPLATVEAGLKVGRIEFSWRELCSWLNPPSKPAQVSINGENRIALPLGVIAPLFLKARGAGQGRRKANVAEDIPDLFSAAGKPLAPPSTPAEGPAAVAPAGPSIAPPAPAQTATPAPTAASVATTTASKPTPATIPTAIPAPVNPPAKAAVTPAAVAASAPVAAAPKKTPANLSELFGEPNKKTWTPNEIVQRTTQLSNVAGALIALQDGLLVASNMPPDMRTETIAAFVPQIFGRLNQYSKELQLGETKAVSFTVSTGTVQVYNAGIIYFAALSKPGALLPLAELQLIAGELGRHTK